MSKKIKEHLVRYCKKNDWDYTDDDLQECIEEGHLIFEEKINSRRWWDDVFVVVEVDGVLIGYDGARTTGDNHPSDIGWEFEWESVCEVEAKEEIIKRTIYIQKEI